MLSRGFVSLVALAWFSFVLAFISGALVILNNYLQALENLRVTERELAIEKVVIAHTYQMFSTMSEENDCDYIDDYEVCWYFGDDEVNITIDYQEYQKSIWLSYNWDLDCWSELAMKVDK